MFLIDSFSLIMDKKYQVVHYVTDPFELVIIGDEPND